MVGDITTTDAGAWSHTTQNDTVGQATETLIYFDENLKVLPRLAESWEVNSDFTRIRLNLRKGVQFHSGRELTSDDVNYNLQHAKDPKNTAAGLISAGAAWWTNIDMPDKSTIVLTSDKPRPGVFDFLNFLRIQDKDVREGPDAAKSVGGTGPFKWTEYVAGDHITMTRNASYWESGKPYLDEYRITVFRDDAAQLAAFEAGNLDLLWLPQIADALRLRSDPRNRMLETHTLGQFFYAIMNAGVPPTDQQVVRQAIGYAINRKQFAEQVLAGLVPPVALPWAPMSPAFESAKNNFYTFDLDKASSVLKQAGVSDLAFDIAWSTGPGFPAEYMAAAQMMQADFAKIGVSARLNPLAPADFGPPGAGNNPTFNGMRMSAGAFAHLYEASMEFQISRTMGYQSNAAGYYDDGFTQLVTTAATEPDAAKRKQLYSQINDTLLDAAYIQVLSPYPDLMIYRSNVQGIVYEQASTIPFRNVWLSS